MGRADLARSERRGGAQGAGVRMEGQPATLSSSAAAAGDALVREAFLLVAGENILLDSEKRTLLSQPPARDRSLRFGQRPTAHENGSTHFVK
ncbi:hypothetical protein MLD38_003009 [Melastoma candidum]|uniref:Uncharacterized protein n=1 Tax=Melastoma candidum TaxID=119954 RepID=A0ACB9S176_9MYRT|nr:hypothetical protein MLD38_003009 [Melastoma candidum]